MAVADHLAHVADAFGALGLTLVPREDLTRTAGPLLDRFEDLAFTDAVAVADVQGGDPTG